MLFVLLAAVTAANVATIVGTLVAVMVLVIAALYAIRYVKATGAQAQLAAKDEIIATNAQTISSLEKRLETLGDEHDETRSRLVETEKMVEEMNRTIIERDAQYQALKQYTAPEAFKEITDLLTAQYVNLIHAYGSSTDTMITAIGANADMIRGLLEGIERPAEEGKAA